MSSRAKAAAIEAARRRQMRKRLYAALTVGVLLLAILAGGVLATRDSGSSATPVTQPTLSTTTTAPLEPVNGKPCLGMVDPVPAGAPQVTIPTGPPPTTLISQDIKVGDGAEASAASTVTANYYGVSCSTGKLFDSSYQRGQPSSFPLANVIQGWQQGIPGMKVGGQRLLGIPPDLAYGDNPPPDIAPGETLWFVIDIVSVTT